MRSETIFYLIDYYCWIAIGYCKSITAKVFLNDDDDDEIAYFTVRWKTRLSLPHQTCTICMMHNNIIWAFYLFILVYCVFV